MMDRICAIYARQSIDKPDSISIESQIERCRLEAAAKPTTVYADRGFSGKNTDRPQFQKMLEAVRRGEIDCVICYKLDQCSRSVLDFTQLMELFKEAYSDKGWSVNNPDLPIVFMSGDDDPCMISRKRFERVVEHIGQRGYNNVRKMTYPKMRHEILNEVDKQRVWDDILAFINDTPMGC